MVKKAAKKKAPVVTRTVTTEEITGASEADTEETEEVLDDDVVRALTELEGATEVRWVISRVSNPDPGYCGECSTAELSLQYVAENFGPGKYQVRGIRPNGTYFKSGRITIAKHAKKETPIDVLSALKNQSGDQTLLLALMKMQADSTAASSTANAQIISAALARPERPTPEFPWKELLAAAPAALVGLKEFFKSKDDGDVLMDRFLKQLSIIEKMRGGGDDKGTTWLDIVREAVPSVSSMVARATGSTNGSGAQSVAHAPATVASSAVLPAAPSMAASLPETPTAVATSPELEASQWMKQQLDALVRHASKDRNPEVYADMLLEESSEYLPDDILRELLSREDWFDQLQQFDARVQPYFGWFDTFRQAVLTHLNEALNDDKPTDQ